MLFGSFRSFFIGLAALNAIVGNLLVVHAQTPTCTSVGIASEVDCQTQCTNLGTTFSEFLQVNGISTCTCEAGILCDDADIQEADHPCLAQLPETEPTCWDSLDDIWCNEWQVAQDHSVTRTYYLCPGEYSVGFATTDNAADPWVDGERGILLQPNMEIICGIGEADSGKCTLTGGDFHLQAANGGDTGNNLIQGLVFNQAFQFTFVGGFAVATQSLTFKECAFVNNFNGFVWSHFFLDPSSTIPITYTFEDVLFENNGVVVPGSNPGLVTNMNPNVSMVFKNVIFRDNNAALEGNGLGFAINTVGSLELSDICFLNNQFLVAPVIAANATTTGTNLFSTVTTDDSSDLLCNVGAEIMEDSSLVCTVGLDTDICTVIGITEAPTLAPTEESSEAPTPVESDSPTKAPVPPPTPAPVPAATPEPSSGSIMYSSFMALMALVASIVSLTL